MDVLAADQGTLYFTCQNELGRSVYYDEGSYRVICSSSILGPMADAEGTNTKADLMARYFSFLSNDPDPHIRASTDELDFGIQYLNYPQTMTLNIRNVGYVDLNVTSVEITGEGFSYTGTTSFDLSWGEWTELEVTFTSANLGVFNGELSIESNDPDQNPLIIDLYGECVLPPDIDVSPGSFNVNIESGSIFEDVLSINNLGSNDLIYTIKPVDLSSSSRGFGGPDDYGQKWIDSNDPDGPVYNWRDISGLGTLVTFNHNDVGTDLMPIGFDFNFYGSNYSEFRINPNGWIGFGDDWTDYHNYELPRLDAPRPAIFGFWDDLDPLQGGDVYYYSTSDSLVVLFDNVIHYPGIYNGTYDFQMIIYANGKILFQYRTVSGDLNSATIGIQNEDASDALLVVFDAPYVENELAVLFYSDPTWLNISNVAGTLPAGFTDNIIFTFDATDLEDGVYEAEAVIVSNDPDEPEVIIPVTLTVGFVNAGNETIPITTKLLGNYPNPFNPTTTINYTLREDAKVTLEIYNIRGQKVITLINKKQPAGYYFVIWNGKDNNNKSVPSGIYFYKMCLHPDLSGKAGVRYTSTKKMILLK